MPSSQVAINVEAFESSPAQLGSTQVTDAGVAASVYDQDDLPDELLPSPMTLCDHCGECKACLGSPWRSRSRSRSPSTCKAASVACDASLSAVDSGETSTAQATQAWRALVASSQVASTVDAHGASATAGEVRVEKASDGETVRAEKASDGETGETGESNAPKGKRPQTGEADNEAKRHRGSEPITMAEFLHFHGMDEESQP